MSAAEWNKAASPPPPSPQPRVERGVAQDAHEQRLSGCLFAVCAGQGVCLARYLCRVIFLSVLLTVTLCVQQPGLLAVLASVSACVPASPSQSVNLREAVSCSKGLIE